ncbi:chemotaxis protein CheY [Sulfuricella sp. T08]|uniref:response regulator n=1 Tax=Sulfuricella sp. T08 TaxID=1632857 RepID=UPI0006179949|nr:response regulator [Sulfuricella sp. T08]GAO37201.1 chemotaxis protein CheY [Sulfuricella sp. T08]
MDKTQRIMIVDDDSELAEMLSQFLTTHGFLPVVALDGAQATAAFASTPPDLVILDLMLPGEDGFSVARRLRAQSDVPIIMLSARGDDIDRIIGLETGADDYMPKPFNPRELLARIRAVLRRRIQVTLPVAPSISFGLYQLNLDTHTLMREDVRIDLTTGEFTLLRIFAQHPNKVLTRDTLVSLVQGDERMPFDRSIDVRVTRLRRKIEPDPEQPVYIRTVWGTGYLFAPSGGDAP